MKFTSTHIGALLSTIAALYNLYEVTTVKAEKHTYNQAINSGTIEIYDNSSLNNYKSGSKVVCLLIYASWCRYCKKQAPVFEEASSRLPSITFVRANAELADGGKSSVGIAYHEFIEGGYPAIIVFKNGQVVGNRNGFTPIDQLVAFITSSAL